MKTRASMNVSRPQTWEGRFKTASSASAAILVIGIGEMINVEYIFFKVIMRSGLNRIRDIENRGFVGGRCWRTRSDAVGADAIVVYIAAVMGVVLVKAVVGAVIVVVDVVVLVTLTAIFAFVI